MMKKQSEAAFQRQVIDLARTYGWIVHHTFPAKVGDAYMTPVQGQAGFPDLVLAHHRKGVLFVELKTQTGRLSAKQQLWRDTLIDAGASWHVWRPDDLPLIAKRLADLGAS
jgi:hypothetical protein